MASYTALNASARNSDTNLGVDPGTPPPGATGAASPLSPTSPAGQQGGGPGENNSLLEHIGAINYDEPLTPPNPSRFSTFSPSIGTNGGGNGVDSARDSVVSDANSAVPMSAAAGAIAGAGLGGAAAIGGGSGRGSAASFPASKELANVNAYDASAADFVAAPAKHSHRKWWIAAGVAALIVAAAVAIPVGIVVSNNKSSENRAVQNNPDDNNGDSGSGDTDTPPTVAITTGGDGSTVTTEDGSTFTYVNKFGGFWVHDPADPLSNNAQPNSWTPPLNTSWLWGVDKVYGVNLGGLFVLEPFIVPALYQKYQDGPIVAEDEWTLSQAMAADTAGGGLNQLEEHYNTFITEEDIAQIAGAGLNWIRLPIPFWAVDEWEGEPFLARTCWKYILRVFRWCRKYGLRVKIDLHTVPGSQNGYNHSGKQGQINFLRGVMGYANAQRMLEYVRIITEFISQPEYKDLIPMFGIMNEPRAGDIGQDVLSNFYLQAYDLMRSITGIGEGNGPYLSLHDGFLGVAQWADFLPGADRINLDVHPYFAFNGQPNTEPLDDWVRRPCAAWGPMTNNSQTAFGVLVAGEFSNAINDCGLYLNGVRNSHTYGGDCSLWEDASQWDDATKQGLMTFAMASFDSLQNWFFWTWKIGNSTAGRVEAPLWSYKAGLEGGWMPTDPRTAEGTCARLGQPGPQFDGTFNAWATGGAGAGTIASSDRAQYTAWPPTSMRDVSGAISLLPTYTATGTVSTLPPDTFTFTASGSQTTSVAGSGWANSGDTASAVTTVAGCSYPDPWDSSVQTMPTATCTGAAPVRFARRTPPPIPF